MDDRYLFKAKRIDNGEWIIGSLIQAPFMGTVRSWISSESEDKERLRSISTNSHKAEWRSIEVQTDTICQCTGLKDKAKNLIWENDIAEISTEDGYFSIDWDEDTARFVMSGDGLIVDFDNFWPHEVEVVGNRVDNPELLEVE